MILKKINYMQHKGDQKYWKISNVNLERINLIIGFNATGKTRLMNIILNLAKIISRKTGYLDGHWELEFLNTLKNEIYNYRLDIKNKNIREENISINGEIFLQRAGENGEIFFNSKNKLLPYSPPKEELTLHVRRDKKEHPFLEELYDWGKSFYGYTFSNIDPRQVLIPKNDIQEVMLENLSAVPYLLVEALKNPKIEKKLIDDFSNIGYSIQTISVLKKDVAGISLGLPLVEVQENDLMCSIDQREMSQGMFRALSLIIIVEHILNKKKYCTIAIDDLGEGLDYERSSKLIKLLFKKLHSSKIQLIVTSNDRFLINAVDKKYLNILERKGHEVTSFNYSNSKKIFDEFEYTGLNNFDLFSKKIYKNSN